MRVSLNTVKQYIDVDLPPVGELVSRINQQLGGVEDVIDLGARYSGATVVKVVECAKHPNADKLSVCKIDAGRTDLIDVVCGANNVKSGMWAVWLPPESTVPATFDDDRPFVLGSRELRGVISHGMLASARELALGDDHDGIVEIKDNDLQQDMHLQAGVSFAKLFGLDDTVIEIENKMFTHRPDLFGQLGVAREISAILKGASDQSLSDEDTRFINPEWYWRMPEFELVDGGLELEVFNDTPQGSPRFMAVAIKGVTVGASPLWLRCELIRWGSKPINNIVDLTNYIMLLTAQPTHAYDYDKLRGHKLGVRMAHDGEQLTLLNGKRYELTPDDIVIADGDGAVGLAGIMGGGNSEVTDSTTRIVLEVANFNMYTVRKSSMRYGLFTDALTRFNKGQSALQCDRVIGRLLDLMPGDQASQVFDLPARPDELKDVSVHGEVLVDDDFINQRLGTDLSINQISSLLRRVNMAVYPSEPAEDMLRVSAPFWRTDIELPEDLVEEAGRLYGFDKLTRQLPMRSTSPPKSNSLIKAKQTIRSSLSRAGANEVLTYSFINGQVIEKSNQDPDQAFKLSNALSPDLQYYRLSITPSLLDKVHSNIKAGHDEFALFEVGKTHNLHDVNDEGLPYQSDRTALVYASRDNNGGSAYYTAKRMVKYLYEDNYLDQQLTFKKLEDFDFAGYNSLRQMCAPFDDQRSAMICLRNEFVGVVGEYKLSVVKSFKLPIRTSGFELFVSPFTAERSPIYLPLSRFPSSRQDVSLQINNKVSHGDLEHIVKQTVAEKASSLTVLVQTLSIYQAEGSDRKTVTFRILANNPQATLTDSVVSQLVSDIAQACQQALGAKLM